MDRLLAAEHLNLETKFIFGYMYLRIWKKIFTAHNKHDKHLDILKERGFNCRIISLFLRAKLSQYLPFISFSVVKKFSCLTRI